VLLTAMVAAICSGMAGTVTAAETTHTLTIITLPENTGVAVDTYEMETGAKWSLTSPNPTDYRLIGWFQDGSLISEKYSIDFEMPDHDVTYVRRYVYDPALPGNPKCNSINTATNGLLEIFMDYFTPGSLGIAINELHDRENFEWKDVWSVKVKGKVQPYDFVYPKWISHEFNPKRVDFSRTDLSIVSQKSWSGSSSLTTVLLPECLEMLELGAFENCKNLNSITCYAKTPPMVDYPAFIGMTEGATLYVPVSSVELYKEADGWKDFVVKPISDELTALTVNLPLACADGRCKDMRLEVVNANSGVRQKYIISDRMAYVFDLVPDCIYNVYLYSQKGDRLTQMENIELGSTAKSILLPNLRALYDVTLRVRQPDGTDASSMVTARWFTADGTYITTGNCLTQLTEGTKLTVEVRLPEDLARVYVLPQTVEFEVADTNNEVVVDLKPLQQRELTGLVMNDDDGSYLTGALVQLTQELNGRYKHDAQTNSDSYGAYTLSLYDGPATLTVSHDGYLNTTVYLGGYEEGMESLPAVRLKPIKTTTIVLKVNGYDDYSDLYLDVYNVSKKAAVTDIRLQYPYLVLPEDVGDADRLIVTAHSHEGHFNDVTAAMLVSDGQLTLDITPYGSLQVTYDETYNDAVRALLYDDQGSLVDAKNCEDSKATFSYLPDGDYTVVLIGDCRLFTTVTSLSALSKMGLREKAHYVKGTVKIEVGKVSETTFAKVPLIVESAFRFTDYRASFVCTTNEPRGGFAATFRASIGFLDEYAGEVNNLRLIVDYDDNLEFVDGSVVLNSLLSDSYALGDHTLQVDGIANGDEVKFCLTPLGDGMMNATAYVQFDYHGQTICQPIGTVRDEVTSTNIVVKSPTSEPCVTVTLKNIPYGFYPIIEILDNGQVIGTVKDFQSTDLTHYYTPGLSAAHSSMKKLASYHMLSTKGGQTSVSCNLYDPYYYSTHNISARLTADDGTVRYAKSKSVYYNPMGIHVRVEDIGVHQPEHGSTMINYTHSSISNTSVSVKPKPEDKPTFVNLEYYAHFDYNPHIITDNLIKRIAIKKYYTDKHGRNAVSYKRLHYGEPDGIYWFDGGASFVCGERCDLELTPNNLAFELELNPYSLPEDKEANNRFVKRLKAEIAEVDVVIDQINKIMQKIEAELDKSKPNYDYLLELIEKENDCFAKLTNGIKREVTEAQKQLIRNYIDATTDAERKEIRKQMTMDFTKMPGYQEMEEMYEQFMTSVLYFEPMEIKEGVWTPAITYEIGTPTTGNFLLDMSDGNWHAEKLLSEENQDLIVFVNDKGGDRITIDFSAHSVAGRRGADNKYYVKREDTHSAAWDSFINDLIGNGVNFYVSGALVEFPLKLIDWLDNGCFLWGVVTPITDPTRVAYLEKVSAISGGTAAVINSVITGINANDAWNVRAKGLGNWDDLIMVAETACKDTEEARKAIELGKEYRSDYTWVKNSYLVGITSAGICAQGAAFAKSKVLAFAGTAALIGVDALMAQIQADYDKVNMEKMNDFMAIINALPECRVSFSLPGEEPITSGFVLTYDPSGYVYEAVPSNRLEGVTATCYYKDSLQNNYGDWEVHEVMWNAEDFDQVNPQLTDGQGKYGWDVPMGKWQVRYQKDGYEPTRSEWLPVPPPQLEVNIPMVQRTAPEVSMVHAYQDGVELLFSKYMQPETLTTDNLKVKVVRGGTETYLDDLKVKLLNEEASAKGSTTTYASYLKLTSEKGWQGADEVVLIIDHSVKSYCGVPMQETFMQRLDVELRIEDIVVTESAEGAVVTEDTEVAMPIGGSRELKIKVVPAEAGAGKTLRMTSSFADLITMSTEGTVVLDGQGEATVTLTGKTAGSAALTLTIDGELATKEVVVEVLDPVDMVVKTPVATPPTGTVMNVGDVVTLSTKTEGAQIYYTTDGSCPCDETSTRKLYTAPIVITNQTVIKAMAVKDGWTPSEVATFVYTIMGDVNGDGAIDVADIGYVIDIMAGGQVEALASARADVNGDGVVDVADIATVISIMAAQARLQAIMKE